MKKTIHPFRFVPVLAAVLLCGSLPGLRAGDLSFTTNPQDTDSYNVLFQRQTLSLSQIARGGSGGSSTPGAASTQVTPTITNATTGSTVTAGSRSLTFVFSSNFTGTVLGVAYNGSADAAQPLVPPPGCTLSAVAYTVTAGSVRIVDIR